MKGKMLYKIYNNTRLSNAMCKREEPDEFRHVAGANRTNQSTYPNTGRVLRCSLSTGILGLQGGDCVGDKRCDCCEQRPANTSHESCVNQHSHLHTSRRYLHNVH